MTRALIVKGNLFDNNKLSPLHLFKNKFTRYNIAANISNLMNDRGF